MNIVIVEDSRLARLELRELLGNFPDHQLIGEADNLVHARQLIEQQQPDLVLLDIQLPDGDGFTLLEQLSFVPEVIFITAYDDYAVNAFRVNAIDYLLKPVSLSALENALLRAQSSLSARQLPCAGNTNKTDHKKSRHEQIFFKDGDKLHFIRLANVLMFEVDGNYTRIYSQQGVAMLPRSLSYLSDRLNEKEFFRANRQQIVNLDFVASIEPWINDGLLIRLSTGQDIEVSRRQARELRQLLTL